MTRGYITQDPDHCFGDPRLTGRSMRVNVVYDLYLGERKSKKRGCIKRTAKWMGITEAQVRACIRYEKRRKERRRRK